jgi:phosphate/sulfate permease
MFYSKKPRSWYILAMWALVFAGFLYSVSRFFLHAVDKEAKVKIMKPTAAQKASKGGWEELFV